jgi:hypothetical protein
MHGLTAQTGRARWVRVARALASAAILFTFGSMHGCGPDAIAVEYCEAVCDCEDCSDRELEDCEIKRQGRIDRYAIYDCEEDYIEYLECFVDKAECDKDSDSFYTMGDDCSSKNDRYQKCRDRASDIEDD